MKKAVIWVLLLFCIGMVACSPSVTDGLVRASGKTLVSKNERIAAPVVAETDRESLAAGNSAFAFALYRELKDEAGNLFYSPYSISAALAMTWAGARGETERQMADALRFELSQDALHPAFNWLERELDRRGEGAEGKDDEGFRLNVVNAIWGQKDYEFMVDFLDTLASNYGAGLRILDFIDEPDKSRITINDWVSEQTEERIKDLIPSGAINTLTRLVLTNAIYFNAAWANPFDENSTADGPFHLLDGGSVTVSMMREEARFGYTDGENYRAVELPYDGHELSMVILLPDDGRFAEFENSLDSSMVADVVVRLAKTQVGLTMPKFEYESSFGLVPALSVMGMPVAFTDRADFSGMTGNTDLFIADVIHKAFVSVDEAGTEAAAATAVIMEATSLPPEPVVVTVDRPFIFFIRDIQTGAVLFVGRVLDPS